MILLEQNEMKRIDQYTCEHITPSIELMEKAGTLMGETILKHYSPKKVLLLCTPRGNGGDGFVVGRYLMERNIEVDAYLTSKNFSSDCERNFNLFKGKIYDSLPELSSYDLIVDALIGIGLKSRLKDEMIDIINIVNDSKIKIVSLDMPTGIHTSTGVKQGAFIKSDLTITVEYPKTGLFLEDGLDSYSKLEIIKVGMIEPSEKIYLVSKEDFIGAFPERKRNSNKGTYGKASIIGGSSKYPGASLLAFSSLSSFMMGVGYSYLYVPESIINLYKLVHPEIIVNSLDDIDGHIKFNTNQLDLIMKNSDAIALGMGQDVSKDLYDTIEYLLLNYDKTLIIDADGLNSLARYGVDILLNHKCQVILTPHIGEFSRLINMKKEDLLNDSLSSAKSFAKKYKVVLALKSASTIITDGNEVLINVAGTSSLAKAGSGDTLSGILAGVAAYTKIDTLHKCALGCYLFGKANELASQDIEAECLRPQDNVKCLNSAIKGIKR